MVKDSQCVSQHVDGFGHPQHIFGSAGQVLKLTHHIVAGVTDQPTAETRQPWQRHKLVFGHLGPQRIQQVTFAGRVDGAERRRGNGHRCDL